MDNTDGTAGVEGASTDPSDKNQIPESETETTRRDWPGKSKPGHIKPIGPAYLPGSKPSSTPDEGE